VVVVVVVLLVVMAVRPKAPVSPAPTLWPLTERATSSSRSGQQSHPQVTPKGIISTVAAPAPKGFSGDGGAAKKARLNSPSDVAVDSAGNLFIVDSYNNRIRKVSRKGIITTVGATAAMVLVVMAVRPKTPVSLPRRSGI
jgi:hypothetical protein